MVMLKRFENKVWNFQLEALAFENEEILLKAWKRDTWDSTQ